MAFVSREVRNLIDKRDGRICQKCGYNPNSKKFDVMDQNISLPSGLTNDINIHHILPRQYGGSDDPSNLITLCRVCHSNMHIEFQAKYFTESIKLLFHIMVMKIKSFLGSDNAYDLNLALKLLTSSLSFRYPQKEIIKSILSGRDTLVVMPTGSGKSICYQLPGLISPGESLVISPLKSLMKDQVESLQSHYVTATYVNGDLSKEESTKRIELIKQGLYKFVYATPEKFFNKFNKYQLSPNNPLIRKYSLLAVDEAHCIDQWGRSFRKPYSRLGELRSQLGNVPTIALTASASREMQKKIIKSLKLTNPNVFVTGFYRPEIQLEVIETSKVRKSKDRIMDELLMKYIRDKVIIFVPTIKAGQKLYDKLDKKFNVSFYHSKCSEEERRRMQDGFSDKVKPGIKVLIATSAFGMGINIPDIRVAIHYGITANIEDYYQQVGRAGRDHKESHGILLYDEGDSELIRYMNRITIENSNKSDIEKTQLYKVQEAELESMLGYVKSKDKWKYILNYFGERDKKLKIIQWFLIFVLAILVIIWISRI